MHIEKSTVTVVYAVTVRQKPSLPAGYEPIVVVTIASAITVTAVTKAKGRSRSNPCPKSVATGRQPIGSLAPATVHQLPATRSGRNSGRLNLSESCLARACVSRVFRMLSRSGGGRR
jgi:hypothetical protein